MRIEQFAWKHPEGPSEDLDDVYSGALASLFDGADLVAVEIGLLSQVFLSPPPLLPEPDHVPGQLCAEGISSVEFLGQLPAKHARISSSAGQLLEEIAFIGHDVHSVASPRMTPPRIHGLCIRVVLGVRRAMEWYLGRSFTSRTAMDDEEPLESVVLLPVVQQQLSRQLDVKGRWQGGVLFGEETLGTLTVRVAAPLGPPAWAVQPLFPHLPYLIGWSDSVAEHHGPALDWCGNWIAAPDSRLPDERLELNWLHLGAQQGLFDDTHPLVVLGLQDGRLAGRVYAWAEDGPLLLGGPLGNPFPAQGGADSA